MKISRWPARNPAGDQLRTKIVWYTSWTVEVTRQALTSTDTLFDSIPAFGTVAPLRINDPYAWVTWGFWPSPAHTRNSAGAEAARLFMHYRADGMKMSFKPATVNYTCSPEVSPVEAANVREIMANEQFCILTDASDADPDAFSLPLNPMLQGDSSRWGKIIPMARAGVRSTWKSVYYGTKMVQGTSAYIKGDLQFTGDTDTALASGFSSTQRPVSGPIARIGVAYASGGYIQSNWPVTTVDDQKVTFRIPMKFTWYMTYFGKRPVTQY